MKFYFLITLIFLILSPAFSQKHDYVWVTGNDNHTFDSIAGFGGSLLDFNFTPLYKEPHYRKLEMRTCNASICDTAGNLRFYTNGCDIAGADDEILENGDDINPGSFHSLWCSQFENGYNSGFQSALILPLPDSDSIYYLFHKQCKLIQSPIVDVFTEKLLYSRVEFPRPWHGAPKGKVVEKNISVMNDTLAIGDLTAVKHANGKDWWLITPRRNSNTFYKFKFTQNGITDTLVQTIGFPFSADDEIYGQSVFSPDGTKLYRANRNAPIQVYDFDRETGDFTHWDTIHYEYGDQFIGEIGCAVSPSGQFLYLSCRNFLYQLDLLANDVSASQTTLSEWDGFTTPLPTLFYKCQLAPDCKIYTLAGGDTKYWHVIHNPNLPGLQCNVEQRGLVLPTRCGGSLPFSPNYRLGPIDNPGLPCTGVYVPVGVQEAAVQQEIGVWAYPNPASETVTIAYKMPSGAGGHRVRMCNAYGQVVREARLSGADGQVEVSVVGLPEGVYFYFVEGVGSGKVVVGR